MGTLSGVAPIPVPFLPPFSLQGEQILSFLCTPYVGRAPSSREPNKSQKLFSFIQMVNGWTTCNLMSFSTIFQSYRDNGRVIMKGCVQYGPCL